MTKIRPTFQVPATRGKMGETVYYTATLPFGAVSKLFTFDPDEMMELAPENRQQRTLNEKRVPEIAAYILDHGDYIFSAITVSVDSDEVEFKGLVDDSDIGELVLPLEAKYIINDGQHRVAGIAEALRSDPELAEDSISVVILPDRGLERSQQIFSDLNRTVHKTSKSLDILFDHRLPINRITMACAKEVPLFKGRIDKERVSLSVRSAKFATLSGLQKANEKLLGELEESISEDQEKRLTERAVAFWTNLTELIPPWQSIIDGDMKPQEARQLYVSSYALSLWALGDVGAAALADSGGDILWTDALAPLEKLNWLKSNQEWQGICMTGNEIVTRAPTRKAMAEFLKWAVGLSAERPAAVLEVPGSKR